MKPDNARNCDIPNNTEDETRKTCSCKLKRVLRPRTLLLAALALVNSACTTQEQVVIPHPYGSFEFCERPFGFVPCGKDPTYNEAI